jgi:hypothetical protein
MSNTLCFVGPAFSINGNALFVGQQPAFSLNFNSPQDQSLVLAYEWYLDDILLGDQKTAQVSFVTSQGSHKLQVRIFTADGWSGKKSFSFISYPPAIDLEVTGPATVSEGTNEDYFLTATFVGGLIQDVSLHWRKS